MTPEEAEAAAAAEFAALMKSPHTATQCGRARFVCDVLADDGVELSPVLLLDTLAYCALRLAEDDEGYAGAAFISQLTTDVQKVAPEALS